jgi:tripartite-type tricarboxylate transporter receptor subunit TctC
MPGQVKRASGAVAALALAAALAAAGCGDTGGEGGGGEKDEGGGFERPLTMIIPFGPGVGSDQAGRLAARVMEKEIGVQMPAVNVPGATGNTGATKMLAGRPEEAIATFPADTLATVVAGTSSFKLVDVAPICRISTAPSSLWVNTKGDHGSWEELARAAKQRPGKIAVATVGKGGIDDIMLGALAQRGYRFRAVPFSEGSERKGSVLSGDTAAIFEQAGDVRENLDSGQFKPVLQFGSERQEGLEGDYVLSSELGITEVVDQWRGLFASADMPSAQLDTLSTACAEVEDSEEYEEFRERALEQEGGYMDRETFERFVRDEEEKMRTLGRRYGVYE